MDWIVLFFAILAFIISNVSLVMVLALKHSTHRIEWRPLEGHQNSQEAAKFMREREQLIEEDFL